MHDAEVVIVGGGAAGIAAARHLVARGRTALIVEALPRLGGRAHTVEVEGMRLDLGCGWLHSAGHNPLRFLAEQKGVAIDRSPGAWRQQFRDLGFPAADQREAWESYRRFKEGLTRDPPPSDRAADAFPSDGRWIPFLNGVSSFVNGEAFDQVSAADVTRYDAASSGLDWRFPGGYGAFVSRLGHKLPLKTDCRVTRIREAGGITVETTQGTRRAKAVIITVSTAILAGDGIQFDPQVEGHLHAASQLPLGLANKLFLSVADSDALPSDAHLLGRPDTAATGTYYLRPFGRPVIEAFFGGDHARRLEAQGTAAMEEAAIEELTALLGREIGSGLRPILATRWGHEPSIGGSYSHALPGQAAMRDFLAHPVSERLCFAGEACSIDQFSTTHGAWQSGIDAADSILRSLGAPE